MRSACEARVRRTHLDKKAQCHNGIQNGKRCSGASKRCAQGPDLAVPADIFRPTGRRWPEWRRAFTFAIAIARRLPWLAYENGDSANSGGISRALRRSGIVDPP
ncbi:hypothetical protein PTKU64_34570 [Paraburkholderia terrae]|uniref:Uncharacterized protein n=1 Tax=Paraburkholderia terrae TaxID=311230 RepID=A0ABM7TZE5_9BURK|nr:hypothetical protein PTKU64_34570 [Paraburkholderia terrae]BDC41751.1 hypothetical protein PTKU15_50480 [Paraburkholderia terrae]